MSDGLISILAICGIMLVLGGLAGAFDRSRFSPRWLLVAALLVFLNDAALTRGYGLLPDVLGGEWNWTGKLLALALTLAVASHPAFGWRRSGLTVAQRRGSLLPALLVSLPVIALYLFFAVTGDEGPASGEAMAFQLTMPGLEEEPFYRGILLLALAEAFRGRTKVLGADLGWGAILSSVLFGLAHAFAFEDGSFAFDPLYFLLTAVPALLLVWMRERTGSLLLPILLHNFGNTIGYFV
jgi:membrane protease YdiL (CAAX protease family)